MPVRIAILSNYPSDHASFSGGVETATAALLEGLGAYQTEFEFHLVAIARDLPQDMHDQRDGFWFHFLSIPQSPYLRPRLIFRIARAYRELRRIGPDLVHCQDNMALAMATIASGYPRVFTIHGVKRHEAPKRTGWEFWSASADALIERFVHRHFDAFICISRYAAQIVGEERLSFAIPNPVRSLFFERHVAESPGDDPYLLFVGVLAPLKRPADLLKAHIQLRREYPNLETVFCGDVEDAGYSRSMDKMVAKHGIGGVAFLGRVSQQRLASLLEGALALVLPSAQENAPMVIAEAMAVGVPVVATRVGGTAEMVRHGQTGFLYDVADTGELTNHLRALLTNPLLREKLGEKAREVAIAAYSPRSVAAATVTGYRQLLDQRGSGLLKEAHG